MSALTGIGAYGGSRLVHDGIRPKRPSAKRCAAMVLLVLLAMSTMGWQTSADARESTSANASAVQVPARMPKLGGNAAMSTLGCSSPYTETNIASGIYQYLVTACYGNTRWEQITNNSQLSIYVQSDLPYETYWYDRSNPQLGQYPAGGLLLPPQGEIFMRGSTAGSIPGVHLSVHMTETVQDQAIKVVKSAAQHWVNYFREKAASQSRVFRFLNKSTNCVTNMISAAKGTDPLARISNFLKGASGCAGAKAIYDDVKADSGLKTAVLTENPALRTDAEQNGFRWLETALEKVAKAVEWFRPFVRVV